MANTYQRIRGNLNVPSSGGSFSAPWLAPNGLPSAPSYAFINAPNAGMYWDPSKVTVAIAVNGIAAMFLAPSPINDPNLAFQANATSSNPTYFAMHRNGAYGALFGLDFNVLGSGVGGAVMRAVNSADSLAFVTNNSFVALQIDQNQALRYWGGLVNGQTLNLKQITAQTTLSGASTNLLAIPAGALVMHVATRVTTAITGATSWNLGDGTTANKWGAAVALASGTTTTGANALAGTAANVYPAGANLVATAVGSNFTAGVVRATVFYFDTTAPTS